MFPKAYGQLLNCILAVFGKPLAPRGLRASLREVGQIPAQEHLEQVKGKSREQRIEFALRALKALGVTPQSGWAKANSSFAGMAVRFLRPRLIIRKLA